MTPNFLPTRTLLSGPGSGRAAWGKVWVVERRGVQKGPPSGDSGAQVAMVPFLRQGQGNSGPEVGAGVWVGSDQFWKSPYTERVLSECAHVERSYLKGDKGGTTRTRKHTESPRAWWPSPISANEPKG